MKHYSYINRPNLHFRDVSVVIFTIVFVTMISINTENFIPKNFILDNLSRKCNFNGY